MVRSYDAAWCDEIRFISGTTHMKERKRKVPVVKVDCAATKRSV